jgi:hypothetical protein
MGDKSIVRFREKKEQDLEGDSNHIQGAGRINDRNHDYERLMREYNIVQKRGDQALQQNYT